MGVRLLTASEYKVSYLYLSGLNRNSIKVIFYCTSALRQAAVANGRNVKIVPYRNPFSPPWLRKLRNSQCTRPLRPPVFKYTPTWGEPSNTCVWKALAISLATLELGERTSISTCGPTRFWDFWSHTHQRSHTPHTTHLYPSYPQASSKRQILSVPF